MSRSYNADGRMPIAVPWSADFIPAGPSWGGPPAPPVNDRGSAFKPQLADALQMYPRWSYSVSAKTLTSRFLNHGLIPDEVNARLNDCWQKYGAGSVEAIAIHCDPDWCKDNPGLLRAYKYERAIWLESSGVTRCHEMAWITRSPRLMQQ
jgi:hypothetical protein